jgi:hypothetical protein
MTGPSPIIEQPSARPARACDGDAARPPASRIFTENVEFRPLRNRKERAILAWIAEIAAVDFPGYEFGPVHGGAGVLCLSLAWRSAGVVSRSAWLGLAWRGVRVVRRSAWRLA